jgi:hypothetical protein
MTIVRDLVEILPGCSVKQSVTIEYPLDAVPKLKRVGRRPLKPNRVILSADRAGNDPWKLHTPLVIGREILVSGRLSSVEHTAAAFYNQPSWLVDIVEHVEARLNEEC